MQPGSSFLGLLTSVLTRVARIRSAGNGRSSLSGGVGASSQASWSFGSRITGMRLWIGAQRSLGCVVQGVQACNLGVSKEAYLASIGERSAAGRRR